MIIGTANEGKEAACLLIIVKFIVPLGTTHLNVNVVAIDPMQMVWCGELAYDEIFIRLYDLFQGEELSINCQEELCLVIEALCFS